MLLNLKKFIKNNLGRIAFFTLLVFLWQSLQIASSIILNGEAATTRVVDAIRQVSPDIIRSGDIVLLSTQNALVQNDIDRLGALTYKFNPKDNDGFQIVLAEVLQSYCNLGKGQNKPLIYFIWTQDNKQTAMELSSAVRTMNFFFTFQALLPYEGSSAFAIDKMLRLLPKEKMIKRFCEATELTGNNQVVLVLNENEFSPWIGSVNIGRITWLSGDPDRKMFTSDFIVKDMPPLIGYDVYWLEALNKGFSWSFVNQDTEAYEKAVKHLKTQNGIVLVDSEIELGSTATRFIKECDRNQVLVESQLFHQMCLK